MASIKYFIKSGTNKIYVSVSTGRKENGGFQLRKSINRELVNSKNWNNKKETVKITPEEPNAQKINTYIQIHKSRILKRAGEVENKDENILLSKKDYEDIIDTIDGSYHLEKETKKFNFTELLDDFYNLAKNKQIFIIFFGFQNFSNINYIFMIFVCPKLSWIKNYFFIIRQFKFKINFSIFNYI